jgi:leucyl-tRNA synthetase
MVVHETYKTPQGEWISPAEVEILEIDGRRQARRLSDGAAVEIGSIEKMSKSKKNVVDPDEIIGGWGADTARWFMLSDSPPDRDVIWTEAGVEGAHRFVQRVWRLLGEALPWISGPVRPPSNATCEIALGLRKAAHKALIAVEDDLEKLGFNRAVARIYELTNALQRALAEGDPATDPALAAAFHEAFDILIRIIAPMMPHLAEECWSAMGRQGMLATADWPVADHMLIVDETITLPVQINGKKRGELTIAREASEADVRSAVLGLDIVVSALEGREPRKVIVVAQRIVNVVA